MFVYMDRKNEPLLVQFISEKNHKMLVWKRSKFGVNNFAQAEKIIRGQAGSLITQLLLVLFEKFFTGLLFNLLEVELPAVLFNDILVGLFTFVVDFGL
jgi:hypothetical protein